MIWDNFKEMFHESWHPKIKPFIESEECDKIYSFLKKESRRGRLIAPLSSDVFTAFKETKYDNLNAAIFGLSPYHTFYQGKPIANGILMDCSITRRLQPSLFQFYGAIERELYKGLNLHLVKDPSLSYLCEQGVLMTNVALTCEMHKPDSHLSLWEPFMKYLFENVLFGTGVPIVFLGKEAGKYYKYVAPFTWVFNVSHPASASYNHTDWDSEGLFKKINKVVKDNNGIEIQWIQIL